MDLGVLAMEREEHLDLLEIEMMNLLWGSFRLSFVWIHNFAAVELLPVVVVVVAAAEHIAADSNCCFHSHHHISAAAAAVVFAVEGDILRNTHRFREPTMLKRRPRQRRGMREQMI
jgi:hypothetical protein